MFILHLPTQSYKVLKRKKKEIYLTNATSRDMPDSQNQRK